MRAESIYKYLLLLSFAFLSTASKAMQVDTVFTASNIGNDSLSSPHDSSFKELISISHQYEFIPEYKNEVVKARLAAIENEIPLKYNSIVNSFINYFTVTDRDYTRKVASLQTKYFPYDREISCQI